MPFKRDKRRPEVTLASFTQRSVCVVYSERLYNWRVLRPLSLFPTVDHIQINIQCGPSCTYLLSSEQNMWQINMCVWQCRYIGTVLSHWSFTATVSQASVAVSCVLSQNRKYWSLWSLHRYYHLNNSSGPHITMTSSPSPLVWCHSDARLKGACLECRTVKQAVGNIHTNSIIVVDNFYKCVKPTPRVQCDRCIRLGRICSYSISLRGRHKGKQRWKHTFHDALPRTHDLVCSHHHTFFMH